MDFSFLTDPTWLAMRGGQWAIDEDNIKLETSKSKVEKIKEYYFTGKVKKAGDLPVAILIHHFPRPNIEGFQYCFLNNVEEVSDDVFLSVQRIFASMDVPHITEEFKLILFKHIFGDQFSEQREFPFLIGKTQKTLIINLGPHYFFSGATQRYIQKCTRVVFPRSFWFANDKYFFSLFDHLDPIIFSPKDLKEVKFLDAVRADDCNRRLRDLLTFCLKRPITAKEGEDHEIVSTFLDRLQHYLEHENRRPELEDLWQAIKKEHK